MGLPARVLRLGPSATGSNVAGTSGSTGRRLGAGIAKVSPQVYVSLLPPEDWIQRVNQELNRIIPSDFGLNTPPHVTVLRPTLVAFTGVQDVLGESLARVKPLAVMLSAPTILGGTKCARVALKVEEEGLLRLHQSLLKQAQGPPLPWPYEPHLNLCQTPEGRAKDEEAQYILEEIAESVQRRLDKKIIPAAVRLIRARVEWRCASGRLLGSQDVWLHSQC